VKLLEDFGRHESDFREFQRCGGSGFLGILFGTGAGFHESVKFEFEFEYRRGSGFLGMLLADSGEYTGVNGDTYPENSAGYLPSILGVPGN
jgi:hypothetical protein